MKANLLLISEQFPYFKQIAKRSLPDRYKHLAEDLAQDAILKAIENIQKYDPSKGNFKSWLYRLTQNLCFDEIRKLDRLTVIPLHHETIHFAEKQPLVCTEKLITIRKAMKQLCPRDRELITYRLIFNLSGKEIAQLTGIPESQVNIYFKRAKDKLRLITQKAA
jgi:RNA polymerase sigma-70 factor (ECF subfamily)